MSHASRACRQTPSSSDQAASCWGPFRRSGSSALYRVAIAPLGHVTRRLEGSYRGRFHGGAQAIIPDSPSTIMSRASAAVGAINATRLRSPLSTCERTHSAPVLVLPNPRPVRIIQIAQSPAGGNCLGRAQNDQSNNSAPASASDRLSCSRRSSGDSVASRSAADWPVSVLTVIALSGLAVRQHQTFTAFCPV